MQAAPSTTEKTYCTVPAGRLKGLACLSIDVESRPDEQDRIFRLGAVRSDTDATLDLAVGRSAQTSIAQRLNEFARDASLVVGHNVRRHDLPALAAQFPGLDWLHLPVLDTLELSPLAFPRNPYHRLIKGYKLVSDSRNDPLKDAQLALGLLADEIEAFAQMHAADPAWIGVLHFLLRDDPALNLIFGMLRDEPPPDLASVRKVVRAGFQDFCCRSRLERLLYTDLGGDLELRWALAYSLAWLRVAGGNSVLPPWVYATAPKVRVLIQELREIDCGHTDCGYC